MTTTEAIERPDGLTREHLEFLDELREGGSVNMFGAAPYLVAAFDLDIRTARKYVSYWALTFGDERV